MTEVDLMRRLRADALKDLERVRVLGGVLPFTYLEWLDKRAATLGDMIRQYDEALSRSHDGPVV